MCSWKYRACKTTLHSESRGQGPGFGQELGPQTPASGLVPAVPGGSQALGPFPPEGAEF